MQHSDYTSADPYYNNQRQYYSQTNNPNPNHIDPIHHLLPSYASAPPFSTSGYKPIPPSSADSASYSHSTSSYPPFSQNPDHLPTVPSYQQPKPSYSFPQFEAHGTYQPPSPAQSSAYFSSYDQPPPPPNYTSNTDHSPSQASPNPNYPSVQPFSQYPQLNSALYESSYDNTTKNDGYLVGNFGRSRSVVGSEIYGKSADSGYIAYGNDGVYGSNEGVYAYKGSREPYGARGTAQKSSTWSGFDDFGRPIGRSSSLGKKHPANSGLKVVRAVTKVDAQQDAKNGVQKFRVKLLAESVGQSTMDVLCQIGLDGIRMLDPSTIRIMRIYLLDSVSRCEALDSSTFALWSKSSVDIEPTRIRLQSNSYTTNTILDTVTAAVVQFKEMNGRSQPSEYSKVSVQSAEKKKGFGDWVNLIKPVNEEKDHWVPDEAATKCTACGTDFNAFVRKHHCRNCGDIFCDKCTHGRTALTADENAPVVRVCDRCLAEVSQRLSYAKEAASRSTVTQSHDGLQRNFRRSWREAARCHQAPRQMFQADG